MTQETNNSKKSLNSLRVKGLGIKFNKIRHTEGHHKGMIVMNTYDEIGGWISESGTWIIHRTGRYVADEGMGGVQKDWLTDEFSVFDGSKGNFLVKNKKQNFDECYGEFTTLKAAKQYISYWVSINPNDK